MRISVGEASREAKDDSPQARRDAFVEGIWWPVNHEDLQVEGKVSAFGNGSVWLDLDADAWGAVSLAAEERNIDVRVLIGRTPLGTPMSLHGARLVGAEKEVFGDRGHVRYVADRLIFGAAVGSENELLLTSVSASFRGLREWLVAHTKDMTSPLPVVRPQARRELEAKRRGQIRTALRRLAGWLLSWRADTDSAEPVSETSERVDEWVRLASMEIEGVRVQMTVSRSLVRMSQFRSTYDTTASVRLEAEDALSVADWRRLWIEPLRDLVLFGTREQTVLLALSGHVGPERTLPSVSVYTAPDVALQPSQHTEYYQRDLLPAGIWNEQGFADLITCWRTLHRDLGAVAQAFFELLNTADVPPLTRLLRLTSCAEGYHRSLHDEPPFTDEAHEVMVAAMVDALPEDGAIRAHYRDRLRHANSQSQRRRIRWLVDRAADVDERLEGQAARLTSRLIGWRNDQTHLDPDAGAPPLDELLLLNAVLTYVLAANILLDVGIGEDAMYCLAHGYVWDDPIPELVG